MVTQNGEERLWLLVKREETWRYTYQAQYHFELHGHDTRTAQRVWIKRLLTVPYKEGGYNATARILGLDGNAVWLFLHDQPVAVSAADGGIIVDREHLELMNAELKNLIPSEPKFFAHDQGLIITTADGRKFRVSASNFKATPYTPANDDLFRRLSFMATQWNGGYQTKDFLVRQGILWERCIGLYSDTEATDAGNDQFGNRFKTGADILDEGTLARRSLRTARIGKTRPFSEGSHDRLFDVTRLPDTPEFLQGGFLIRAGTRVPLQFTEPRGTLVLHRTRVDAEGRLALSRLDERFREQWKTVLPLTELNNRWEWLDRLLLLGSEQTGEPGRTYSQEIVVAVNPQDGKIGTWNVHRERSDGGP